MRIDWGRVFAPEHRRGDGADRSQLRKHDVQDLAEVDTVRMEYDGRLSVVRRD